MSPSRVAASIGVGTLFVAWLASAVSVPRQPRTFRAPRATPEETRVDLLAADVQTQASRLRKRLAAAPAPRGPSRNPFSFVRREAPVAPVVTTPAEPAPAPAVVEVSLSLIGIAEKHTAAGPVRTAMIVGTDDELFLVTEGQLVAGRFLVVAVAADAVELKDTTTSATRRLVLQ